MKLFPLDYFMQQEFPQACYVKDPNHKLALSEKHILKPVLSRFIDNMSSLRTYVRSSGARSDRWRDLASTLGYGATSVIPADSDTRWSSDYSQVKYARTHEDLLEAYILDMDSEQKMYYEKWMKSWDYHFVSMFVYPVLAAVFQLNFSLQAKMDRRKIPGLINDLKKSFSIITKDIPTVVEQLAGLRLEVEIRTRLDVTLAVVKTEQVQSLKQIMEALDKDITENVMPEVEFMDMLNLFDGKKLTAEEHKRLQLKFEKSKLGLNSKQIESEIALKINSPGKRKLSQFLSGYVSGSVDVERLFSLLKIIATRLRLKMTAERKENLMILSFNRDLFETITPKKVLQSFIKKDKKNRSKVFDDLKST